VGIADTVMLPPWETVDQSFVVDIVLDSLMNKFVQNRETNPDKGNFLHLDNARTNLADDDIKANNITRLSHPLYDPDLSPADFWLFGYLKMMLEGSSLETAENPQEKMTELLMSIPGIYLQRGI
jgi:hypothetical protein